MENLTDKQKFKVNGPTIDINNRLNCIFRSFDPFNPEFFSSSGLVDLFSNCFSFFCLDRKSVDSRKSHLKNLDEVVFNASINSHSTIIISDVSIKNNIVTSIAYVHSYNLLVIKTIYHVTNIISIEAELLDVE